jgi:hypothetical protein
VSEADADLHAFELVLSRGSRAEVTQVAARRDALARVTTRDGALLCTVLPGPAYPAVRHPSSPSSGAEAAPGPLAGF